jgi:hypothetical protein
MNMLRYVVRCVSVAHCAVWGGRERERERERKRTISIAIGMAEGWGRKGKV